MHLLPRAEKTALLLSMVLVELTCNIYLCCSGLPTYRDNWASELKYEMRFQQRSRSCLDVLDDCMCNEYQAFSFFLLSETA